MLIHIPSLCIPETNDDDGIKSSAKLNLNIDSIPIRWFSWIKRWKINKVDSIYFDFFDGKLIAFQSGHKNIESHLLACDIHGVNQTMALRSSLIMWTYQSVIIDFQSDFQTLRKVIHIRNINDFCRCELIDMRSYKTTFPKFEHCAEKEKKQSLRSLISILESCVSF